jgi:mono/diheme cytochrome c family protein
VKTFALTFLATLALGSVACAQQAAPNGSVENGAKHFKTDGCYQCHGASANGASLTGPKLSQTGLPFEAFLMQLRKPSSEMPPYESAVLTDQTAADIYAFVKSLPPSPKAQDVPLIMNMGLK